MAAVHVAGAVPVKSPLSHFRGAFVFSAVAVAGAWAIGGARGAVTVAFLAVLESSLSFDNAVVNAGVLQGWNEIWRRRFVVWGMPVAVFGMRILFPLAIVGLAAHLGPWQVLDMALHSPDDYGRILTSAHHQIAAFGGTFLLMVFLKFFVDKHKTEHWLSAIEGPLSRLGKMESVEAGLTLVVLLLTCRLLDGVERAEFISAGVWGVITYLLTKGVAALLGADDDDGAPVVREVVRQGVAGIVYLEVLDASFSFDGVIAAFAMTNNLFIIALGLGAGAMFVRSFTLLLVERDTLNTYRYLEHGAFWAIGALSAIMLAGVKYDVPEAVTGLIGAALIILSLGSSIRANRCGDK